MGRYKNRGSKSSHKKKRDQKFREKEYQFQREKIAGNVDDSSPYAGLSTVVTNPENTDISEKITKAGPIDLFSTSKHVIGSMISYSPDEEDNSQSEVNKQDSGVKDTKDLDKKGDKKDMFISQRVKRGMVFWYNINPSIDKNNSPTIEVDGKKYLDSIEYGNRPWLVVSSDEINKRNRICTIVPLSSSQSNYNDNSPNKVHIYFCGRDTTILCEQMRTINTIELKEYASTLTDEVMDLVDKGISYAMGIKHEFTLDSINMNEAFTKIDSVIEGVIQNRIKKEIEALNKGRQEAIDDMVLKISDGFETLYKSAIDGVRDDMQKRDLTKKSSDSVELEISQEKDGQEEPSKSQEDLKKRIEEDKPFTSYSTRVAKFYERYPDLGEGKDTAKDKKLVESKIEGPRAIPRKTTMFTNVIFTDSYQQITPPPKGGKLRKWTDELLAQFAYDFKYLPYSDIMTRWDIADEKKVIDMARKVERKLFTGDMNSKEDFSSIKITFPGRVISYV